MIALALWLACVQGPLDRDGDGVLAGTDCDDTDASRFPGADERCNDRDDDCDGVVDEDAVDAPSWTLDLDRDGYADALSRVSACTSPRFAQPRGHDCDDRNSAISPAAEEVCDGVDNDCDGVVDESGGGLWYADRDLDGYGVAPLIAGCGGEGLSRTLGDCDDGDARVFPGAPEVCNRADDDCDGGVDEDPAEGPRWFPDRDRDAYGDGRRAVVQCEPVLGYIEVGRDCVDTDSRVFPGAVEVCDGVDNDCDAEIDGPLAWLDPRSPLRARGETVNLDGAQTAWLTLEEIPEGNWTVEVREAGCEGVALEAQWIPGVHLLADGGWSRRVSGGGTLALRWDESRQNTRWVAYFREGNPPVGGLADGEGIYTGVLTLTIGDQGASWEPGGVWERTDRGVFSGDWLERSPGEPQVWARGPLVGLLRQEAKLGSAVSEESYWWAWEGEATLWMQRAYTAEASIPLDFPQGALSGVRAWSVAVPGGVLAELGDGGDWLTVSAGERHTAAWWTSPSWRSPLRFWDEAVVFTGQDAAAFGGAEYWTSPGEVLLRPVVARWAIGEAPPAPQGERLIAVETYAR